MSEFEAFLREALRDPIVRASFETAQRPWWSRWFYRVRLRRIAAHAITGGLTMPRPQRAVGSYASCPWHPQSFESMKTSQHEPDPVADDLARAERRLHAALREALDGPPTQGGDA